MDTGASCSASNANSLKSLVNQVSASSVPFGRSQFDQGKPGQFPLERNRIQPQQLTSAAAFFGPQSKPQLNSLSNNSFELSQLRSSLPGQQPHPFNEFEQFDLFDDAFGRAKGKEAMIPMHTLNIQQQHQKMHQQQQHQQRVGVNYGSSLQMRGPQMRQPEQFIPSYSTPRMSVDMYSNTSTVIQSHDTIAFEQAFEEVTATLSSKTTPTLQQDQQDWTSEFNQTSDQLSELNIVGSDASSLLAQSAAHLVATVDGAANPKFANSKFLEFMKQIRDGQVGIEGNRVVDMNDSSSSSQLERDSTAAVPLSVSDDWVKEVGGGLRGSSGWYNGYDDDFSINRLGLSAEQQKPLNWTNEILASQESVNETAVNDEDYAIMEEDAFHEFYNATGTGSTMGNLNPLYYEAREKEWEDLSMSWNSIGEGQQSQSGNVQQSQQDLSFGYDFIPNNPHISHPLQHLRDVGSHANLSESILSLEAAVQVDPMDATTWKNLGLRQQENENEVAAISALRKAIELDPTLLDSWIALAVSYTNDSLYSEAYKALEGWIQNNESYSHLLKNRDRGTSQHEFLTNLYLDAVRSKPNSQGIDTGIQMALGVLFNISGEHDKAMDCFQACLVSQPQDYMLWNKLGATLANSKEPKKALEAYGRALQLNPDFLRARYNVAVALLQLGEYKAAAMHLVSILEAQEHDVERIVGDTSRGGTYEERVLQMHSLSSSGTWSTLWMVMDRYLNRPDLAKAADNKNLAAFKGVEF